LRSDDPTDEPQTEEELLAWEEAYTSRPAPRDPDGARWMALGWDARREEWR